MKEEIKKTADVMRQLLEGSRLDVVKLVTDHGYVRVPITSNTEWYSDFCSDYMKSRKSYPKERTIIKRRDTIRGLRELSVGLVRTEYAKRLLPYVEKFYEQHGNRFLELDVQESTWKIDTEAF